MGNLGLGVKGIEIYFPLSPNLSLGIFDESNQEIIRTSYKKVKNLRLHELKSLGMDKSKKRQIKDLMHGLETGGVVQSVNENVEFHNSMQVTFSSRFVYSSDGNFDLAYEMIKKNSEYKGPPQVTDASQ
jgi:hypothetical protein